MGKIKFKADLWRLNFNVHAERPKSVATKHFKVFLYNLDNLGIEKETSFTDLLNYWSDVKSTPQITNQPKSVIEFE